MTKEIVDKVISLLKMTNKTQDEIASLIGIHSYTVGDISRGISWKEITLNFICPIRKNKLINQERYESLYGIV